MNNSFLKKIEDARKYYNKKIVKELLDDEEENKIRKEKLKKIENEQEQGKSRK